VACGPPFIGAIYVIHVSISITGWSLLAGRTTYQRFADFWPKQPPSPFTEALNPVRKYVAP
jgi:hypothetical protein